MKENTIEILVSVLLASYHKLHLCDFINNIEEHNTFNFYEEKNHTISFRLISADQHTNIFIKVTCN